jgi:serine/threonine protein kinase
MSVPKIKKVYQEINRGGFGIIHRVLLEDGTPAARKTFSPKDAENYSKDTIDKLRQRFIKEVLTQQQLPSDSVIPILGHDFTGEHPWFIMPLATRVFRDEIDMARLEGRGPQGLSDILNAMEVIHDLGFVHRDIKPENILFHDGRWKLADFGLISSDATIHSQFSTSAGDRGGTEQYMAPEQYKDFKHATFKADIYSFGAILHDIFDGDNRTPYSELNCAGEIGFVIRKCTLEDPRKRFESTTALRPALLTFLENHDSEVDQETDAEHEWKVKLESYLEWDEQALEQFCFGVERLENKRGVLLGLRKDHFKQFLRIDMLHWKRIVIMYLDWINETQFKYDYCDVLILRILSIFEDSEDVEVKCSCVLAGAELGVYHNRWYVMHRVIRMADTEISENLAKRLSIEFQIDEKMKGKFEKCIYEISLTPERCHPLLEELFKKD